MASMNRDEVDMDNPAFAQQDPHLRISDEDDAGLPPFMRNKYPKRPPLFDSLLNNIRAITKKVEHIKGFKFEFAGALSNNFHLTHSWVIPPTGAQARQGQPNPMKPPQTSTYTLGAQYLGGRIQSPLDQPAYIMTGRWDSAGKLEAGIIKKINDMFTFRLSAYYMNSDPNNAQMHLDLDVTGDDYVHTIKFGTGLYSFNHMQTIGKNLVLGYEMMTLTERNQTLMSYALKYAANNRQNYYAQYVGAADQLILAFNHKILERAYFVSELQYSNQIGETKAVLGYRQKFPQSEVILTANSKMKISTILTLQGMFYQLKLCAIADYKKDSYKFGYGISMGQF